MLAVTVCLSMYPTITTQRLCCSGSATGIVFGMYVTDPILNFDVTDICTTTVYCFLCYSRRQQQQHHAVSVIYTASREDSSITNLQQLVRGS